jgi:hypothetical protein
VTHPDMQTRSREERRNVNRDRNADLLVRFKMGDTVIACGATSAVLRARTFSGELIEARDSVKTVKCK